MQVFVVHPNCIDSHKRHLKHPLYEIGYWININYWTNIFSLGKFRNHGFNPSLTFGFRLSRAENDFLQAKVVHLYTVLGNLTEKHMDFVVLIKLTHHSGIRNDRNDSIMNGRLPETCSLLTVDDKKCEKCKSNLFHLKAYGFRNGPAN